MPSWQHWQSCNQNNFRLAAIHPRAMHPAFSSPPFTAVLLLPAAVPIITHVHGQNSVYDWADGYTEASWPF